MQIHKFMKRKVISIQQNNTLAEAADLMVKHHIGTLPVIDQTGKLIGVLTLYDLLKLVMPDFLKLVDEFDFVHDFGALEILIPAPDVLAQPVSKVISSPISIEENGGLLRAAAILQEHNLIDIPVVDTTGVLVGIASMVDIGTGLIKKWHTNT